MSAERIVRIWCNGLCCMAHVEGKSASDCRERAAKHGWTHQLRPRPHGGPAESLDFCKEHAP